MAKRFMFVTAEKTGEILVTSYVQQGSPVLYKTTDYDLASKFLTAGDKDPTTGAFFIPAYREASTQHGRIAALQAFQTQLRKVENTHKRANNHGGLSL